jgi:hypothetical protein
LEEESTPFSYIPVVALQGHAIGWENLRQDPVSSLACLHPEPYDLALVALIIRPKFAKCNALTYTFPMRPITARIINGSIT